MKNCHLPVKGNTLFTQIMTELINIGITDTHQFLNREVGQHNRLYIWRQEASLLMFLSLKSFFALKTSNAGLGLERWPPDPKILGFSLSRCRLLTVTTSRHLRASGSSRDLSFEEEQFCQTSYISTSNSTY